VHLFGEAGTYRLTLLGRSILDEIQGA